MISIKITEQAKARKEVTNFIHTCESSKYTPQTLKFLRFKCSTKFRSTGTCEKSSIWPV